tara:strand:- start:13045 stop:14130 length:1086 start_codon:yes stop_codon:yes gene_type:complete
MPVFTGLKNNFYTGVVEDRNDPRLEGRVRVRIYGLHTDDKQLISTGDLPWSDVLMPVTSPSLSGLGLSPHGLVDGSTVMGFFRDEDEMQDFVVIGSLFGRPSDKYKIDGADSNKQISRGPDKGFNDSRYKDHKEFVNSVDGQKNSSTGRNFNFGLTLDKCPVRPNKLEFKLGGEGTIIDESKKRNLEENFPREDYSKTKLSDVHKTMQGFTNDYPNNLIERTKGNTVKEPSRKAVVNPTYPFAHIIESESGHVLEMDDTPGAERLHMYHRSGTRLEVLADGTQTMKVSNDSYEIIMRDKKILISGNADIELMNGDYNLITRKGNTDDGGNVFITCDKDMNITAKGAVKIKGNVSINGTAFD